MLRLEKIIPHLFELVLNGIHFVVSRVNGKNYSLHDIMYRILLATTKSYTRMMKLKITNINLNTFNYDLVKILIDTTQVAKNMIFLDLSWTKLYPKDMAELAFYLADHGKSMRNLNLSYNKLEFRKSKNEVIDDFRLKNI